MFIFQGVHPGFCLLGARASHCENVKHDGKPITAHEPKITIHWISRVPLSTTGTNILLRELIYSTASENIALVATGIYLLTALLLCPPLSMSF